MLRLPNLLNIELSLIHICISRVAYNIECNPVQSCPCDHIQPLRSNRKPSRKQQIDAEKPYEFVLFCLFFFLLIIKSHHSHTLSIRNSQSDSQRIYHLFFFIEIFVKSVSFVWCVFISPDFDFFVLFCLYLSLSLLIDFFPYFLLFYFCLNFFLSLLFCVNLRFE